MWGEVNEKAAGRCSGLLDDSNDAPTCVTREPTR